MSIESAKAFMEKMKTDQDFAKKVMAAKDAEERRVLVKEDGFDFSPAELKDLGDEMSDSELDAVAGGGCVLDSCGLRELF
ncbi:bacteriocin propeptide, TIGR03798 family [Desulfitobacterium dichloroeliminans LMG P-21439]|uniref:Bacteriocin propeptide, TIGR03798 family n=1 Tax=Desulfitobacterium dichloroeliminans (strain LMG P-21439 / DCA1) TaxID=871963 RepID=L0FAT4_DESDL|nr:Nif11-like leader peptide family natural product precursor [Desulfitobacterium dichloroeliminans]AGA70033.1 bacteriocin propeptide, TIGR03798 family [Desulfitobacterium dichloroeliminans LMG P-21439]